MEISLMSNNSGTSKIHYVVVFVDMAGDLGVMVKRSNSPFVFCNPGSQWSFSLTVVYKTAVGATDFVHYARLWPVYNTTYSTNITYKFTCLRHCA